MKAFNVLALLVILVKCQGAFAKDCSFGTNSGDLTGNQPLLLRTGYKELLQPHKNGQFIFNVTDRIYLACTSSFANPRAGRKFTATCVQGNTFSFGGKQFRLKDIQCSSPIAKTARPTTRPCYDNSIIAEIGFSINNDFVTEIQVCHNTAKASSYYAHHIVHPASKNHQIVSRSRPSFAKGGFYRSVNIQCLYNQTKQTIHFPGVLGSNQYIDISKNLYLSRGHLAAKADFVLGPSQLATFFYINTAPVWQTLNVGNWARIEGSVRKLAESRNLVLEVYTGAYGISKLPYSGNPANLKELYLGCSSSNAGLVPVPRLFYKVVIDRATKNGVVLISVNNPYLSLNDIKNNEVVCRDISRNIVWVNWQKDDLRRGYSYACEVNNFIQKTRQLPNLPVNGILY